MRLSPLLAFLFTSTVALAADRQINQISVEQSDSDTIIRLFGSDLIRSPKDRVFFAAEASSYSVEPTMMYGDSEYVEVALGMPVMAGQYRISIGPNENTSTLESMVVIGAIGPQGPAGRDGADGRDGVDGLDGSPGADGQDGTDGADGLDGAKGDPGVDGSDGSSCSVTQTISGATLSCTDGTMASVLNGKDGIVGSNGANGIDGKDGSSCSTTQLEIGAKIVCTDGSSALLASSGTVVILPEGGIIGTNNPVAVPQGEIVWMDSNDTVLGLSFGRFIGLEDGYLGAVITNGPPAPVLSGNQGYPLYYLDSECAGLAFVTRTSYLHDVGNGDYLVPAPGASSLGRVLFKSRRNTGSFSSRYREPSGCQSGDFVIDGSVPTVSYELPITLQQTRFPVRIVQLP